MKIAMIGSRVFNDEHLIRTEVMGWFYGQPIQHEFVSGGAKGADSIAEHWVDYLNEEKYIEWKNPNSTQPSRVKTKKTIFLPDWDKYGKRAGFIRNELIIKEADLVIAFWDGQSKGTKHSIDLAIAQGKPTNIYIRK